MAETPILVIGYSRPKTLLRRLETIEKLSNRSVQISLDGARNLQTSLMTQEVRSVAEIWASSSKHKVDIHIQDRNLGIHGHMPIALSNFILNHNKVIVIEDDIEFSKNFIRFVDLNIDQCLNAFAVQGYNPVGLESALSENSVKTLNTRIPTVWGWAARVESIEFFLDFMHKTHNLNSLQYVISQFSKSITKDPLLQNSIQSTWLKKMDRLLKGNGGSWDNWWVLACWASKKNLLMPNVTLSREDSDQSEGQTHSHISKGQFGLLTHNSFDVDSNPKKLNKRYERKQLSIWGISRKYAWAYAVRILRDLKSQTRS